jgi:MFS family permease
LSFLPAAVFGIGQGAAAPVVTLSARELGGSVAAAGVVVALLGLGQVLGDLPPGRIVARVGERSAVLLGSAVGLVGVALSLIATSVVAAGAVSLWTVVTAHRRVLRTLGAGALLMGVAQVLPLWTATSA